MARETIARYKIESEIGRGGMAAVYLAYDPNFRRNVAIKLISGNLQENPDFRKRFEREAQLIARIEHPAIVPVYDYGEEDNQLYLVMRYMQGGSLTDTIKAGLLSLGQAVKIISQIAPALDAVHAQGVVHRDLKPGNILLDGFGNPAISDFGIAHLTAATVDLTGSAVIGTPSYMSPEQVRGDAGLNGQSDIYALGVILFEMLTGRGPFQASTPMGVALKHLSDPLPSIRSFRSDLPLELESILSKAMAKNRERRYESASEFAHELQAISGTSQENSSSSSVPVIALRGEEPSTEMDMGDIPHRATHSSSIADAENFQPLSQSPEVMSRSPIPAKHPTRPSRKLLQVAAIAGLVIVLFMFCSSIGLFGAWAGLGLPKFFSRENQAITPTLTASNPGNAQNAILFADDFSDLNSGWPTIENAQGGYGYQSDGYHIAVNEVDTALWAKTNREDDNVSIYVDVTPSSGTATGYYGLLCRIQNDQNFYYFVIQNNGNYTIGKFKNAEFLPFFNWRQNDAIKRGNQTNRIEAECSDNTLRFYANNVLLGEVTDADFRSGFSGLIAAALNEDGFEAKFNNFLITEAGQ